MVREQRWRSREDLWTYAYSVVPPQTEHRLRPIQRLLDHESADARRVARTWVGRLVAERQTTHILVVSDSPAQNREVNRRLEAELRALQVEFSMTAPMATERPREELPV